MLMDNRTVQRAMQAAGAYRGAIDGDFGRGSKAAARLMLQNNHGIDYSASWPDARVRIAVEQWIMQKAGLYAGEIDGLAGPRTQIALERWQDHITFTRPPLADADVAYQPTVFPRQVEAELRRFYGEPGKNQATLRSPYPLFLDWDLSRQINSFSIHEKCHDSALRVMNRVVDHYGLNTIHELGLDQFGGCLNVRRMRNGSAWSTHAWGIAIDWDADRNPLRSTSKTAMLARPQYARFLDLWAEEGWISLGRLRNFDWMHVQAARL